MIEFTNSIRRLVSSLSETKTRRAEGLFKAEGTKCVGDTLPYFSLKMLLATDEWLADNTPDVDSSLIVKVPNREMERISSLSCPPKVIAVYRIPEDDYSPDMLAGNLTLALDSVQDPGNLGTIVRTADWFGSDRILCSRSTADIYSPKAVMSTMGAISRVRLHYCDLAAELASVSGVPVYGAFMDGENIYSAALPSQAVIVMGNEGQGISPAVAEAVTRRITIPSYPAGVATSESLNVAVATAVIVSRFRENLLK